jgi:hypothetical protein
MMNATTLPILAKNENASIKTTATFTPPIGANGSRVGVCDGIYCPGTTLTPLLE